MFPVMGGFSLLKFLLKYWKQIGIILISLIICAGLIGFGMRYQGLIKDKEILELNLKKELEKSFEKDKVISTLESELDYVRQADQSYKSLLQEIQRTHVVIQDKYETIMGKIDNAKIELNEKGTISKPYVIINSGVPTDYKQLTTENNSN